GGAEDSLQMMRALHRQTSQPTSPKRQARRHFHDGMKLSRPRLALAEHLFYPTEACERVQMTRRSKSRQQELRLATWGGRREGAGRKPKGKRPGVPHVKRETIPRHCPARVTLRVLPDVWNLRHARMMAAIRSVFWRLRGVGGMRLTQFSIQSNHMHLIVEADGNDALSRGMRTLCARIAAELNRVM